MGERETAEDAMTKPPSLCCFSHHHTVTDCVYQIRSFEMLNGVIGGALGPEIGSYMRFNIFIMYILLFQGSSLAGTRISRGGASRKPLC